MSLLDCRMFFSGEELLYSGARHSFSEEPFRALFSLTHHWRNPESERRACPRISSALFHRLFLFAGSFSIFGIRDINDIVSDVLPCPCCLESDFGANIQYITARKTSTKRGIATRLRHKRSSSAFNRFFGCCVLGNLGSRASLPLLFCVVIIETEMV